MSNSPVDDSSSRELLGGSASELYPGEQYVSRRSRTTKKKRDKHAKISKKSDKEKNKAATWKDGRGSRRADSPASFQESTTSCSFEEKEEEEDPTAFAMSRYILSKDNKNKDNLLDTSPFRDDPEDPLAGGSYSDDNFEDEMLDDIELRKESQHNFDTLGDTEKLTRRSKCRPYRLPWLLILLLLGGIVGLVVALFSTNDSGNIVVDSSPTSSSSIPTTAVNSVTSPPGAEKEDTAISFPVADVSLLEASCSVSEFEVNGSQQCSIYCSVVECCWKVGVKNCASSPSESAEDHPCKHYTERCALFNVNGSDEEDLAAAEKEGDSNGTSGTTNGIPDAPVDLSTVCDAASSSSTNSNNADQVATCRDYCSQAECCWKAGVENCASSVPNHACREYTQACAFLNIGSNKEEEKEEANSSSNMPTITSSPATIISIPMAPTNLTTICSSEAFTDPTTGGQSSITCETECFKASCCWKPTATTNCSDNAECSPYIDACSVLLPLFETPADTASGGGGGGGGGGTSSGTGSPMNRRMLRQL